MNRPAFNPAVLAKNRLYRETFTVVIPASDSVTFTKTITANRGDLRSITLKVAGGTDVEYSEVEFDLDDNGTKFLINDNLLPYSPSYLEDKPRQIPIVIDQNGRLGTTFRNSGLGATMRVVVVLFFWPPYDDAFRNVNIGG